MTETCHVPLCHFRKYPYPHPTDGLLDYTPSPSDFLLTIHWKGMDISWIDRYIIIRS